MNVILTREIETKKGGKNEKILQLQIHIINTKLDLNQWCEINPCANSHVLISSSNSSSLNFRSKNTHNLSYHAVYESRRVRNHFLFFHVTLVCTVRPNKDIRRIETGVEVFLIMVPV